MRPLELLLSLANLLTFVALVTPQLHAARWTGLVVLGALLLALAQGLVEGPRQQLIPAYMLTGLFGLAWLLQQRERVAPFALPELFIGLAIGLGLFGLGVSIALPLALPVFRFPRPGGPYQIGTLTYHWVDANRPEIFSPDPQARRELMVQIWYPASASPVAPRAPYLPDADVLTAALAQIHRKPAFVFGNVKYVTSNAIPSAPVATDAPRYSVLIFLEGLTGFRQMNTFQVEELASHGYIVVALDQPSTAADVVFPDGRQVSVLPIAQIQPLVRQSYLPIDPAPTLNGKPIPGGSIIPYLAQDVSFVLDRLHALNQADPNGILTGRLDLAQVGTFGMSLGGIVVGEACRQEPRLRACLVMDAAMPTDVVEQGLRQPSMWITRDVETMRLERRRAGGWSEAEIAAHQTSMRAVFDHLPGDGYFVQVPGMFHSNLTDIPSWSPLIARLGLAGPIDVERAHRIINAATLAFFDRHLKGQPAARFADLRERYPEVRVETRRP